MKPYYPRITLAFVLLGLLALGYSNPTSSDEFDYEAETGGALDGQSSRNQDGSDNYDYDKDEETGEETNAVMPSFISSPVQLRIKAGENVRMPCEVDNMGSYTLLWKREEGDILTAGSVLVTRDKRFSRDGNTLIINNVNITDRGVYICQLSTQTSRELSHTIEVLAPPTAKSVPNNGVLAARKGEPVTLACDVTGFPFPNVTWTRAGKKMPDGQASLSGLSITLSQPNRHHAGLYECSAENGEGPAAKATINLQILSPPEVEVERTSVNSGEGYDTELVCIVHAEPRASVSWLNNGRVVEPKGHISVTAAGSRHVLAIKDVKATDFGNYTCLANNSMGNAHQMIEVSGLASQAVWKPIHIEGDLAHLQWVVESHAPIMEFKLLFRNVETGSVQEIAVPSDSPQGVLYTGKHELRNLSPQNTYELVVVAKNLFGWSRESKVLKITGQGSVLTNEEVNDGAFDVQVQVTEPTSTQSLKTNTAVDTRPMFAVLMTVLAPSILAFVC